MDKEALYTALLKGSNASLTYQILRGPSISAALQIGLYQYLSVRGGWMSYSCVHLTFGGFCPGGKLAKLIVSWGGTRDVKFIQRVNMPLVKFVLNWQS